MTTHADRIRHIAQEAGFSLGSWPDRGTVITADHSIDVTEWITRFAQLVAEDCARVCAAMLEGCHERSEYDAYSPDDAQTIGWVDALDESQKRIRARYSLKD